jgi:tetratricopeptide (TPR) repeat protein
LSSGLFGQQVLRPEQTSEAQLLQVAPRGIDQRLLTARKLIKFHNYSGASELLEAALESRPHDQVVQNLLMSCYEQLKQYLKAEVLARHVVQLHPQNLEFRIKLAELLVLQGKVEEGTEIYSQAVQSLSHFERDRFMAVISSMVLHGMGRPAMVLIDSLRAAMEDSLLFALDRGSILQKRQSYSEAADEYCSVLWEDTTANARSAEKRLMSLLDFGDSSEEVERALLDIVNRNPGPGATRVLATWYIKSGRFDDAFEFAIRQDSLSETPGNALLSFLYQCADRKLHHQVIRMAEHILGSGEVTPFTLDVTFRYADALRGTGRYHDAIAVYAGIESGASDVRAKSDALYYIGEIYLDGLLAYDSALACFDSVLANYRSGVSYLLAARGIPVAYLRMGQVDNSKKHFLALRNKRLNDDMREEVDYNLALLTFFDGKYDSAEVAFRKLMVDYPRGFYVNDALVLVMLISEAKSAPELLEVYSGALFYAERLLVDSARGQFARIVENENKTLADIALFKLASLDLAAGNHDEALGVLEQLIDGFPESYYLPHGMKMKADILVERIGRIGDARDIYRFLLENYPNYPFISEVRSRLRELEDAQVIG